MIYIKTPGDIYDLFKIFIYHFNEDLYIKKSLVDDPNEFEFRIQSILNGSLINDKLYMFFYIPENKISFMAEHFLYNINNDFTDSDYFNHMCEKLKSMDLFGEILKYYIGNDQILEQDIFSVDYLYDLLMKNDIPDIIKFQILHFNFNRSKYCEILIDELYEKNESINKYYIKQTDRIEHIKELLLDHKVQIDLCNAVVLYPDDRDSYFFSISLLQNKFCVGLNNNNKFCVLLGYETIQNLETFTKRKIVIDIGKTSKALSDGLRIDIVNMIKEKGEINTTDIAELFNKGLTAMYYHLNMLYEAHVLKIRNEGRTVYYSINAEFLNDYSAYIKKFLTEGGVKL